MKVINFLFSLLLCGGAFSQIGLNVGPGGFPTLEAARDHVRTLPKNQAVTVTIAPGIYSLF